MENKQIILDRDMHTSVQRYIKNNLYAVSAQEFDKIGMNANITMMKSQDINLSNVRGLIQSGYHGNSKRKIYTYKQKEQELK